MQISFFHVTARKHLASIAAEGLRAGAYLSQDENGEVRDYYAGGQITTIDPKADNSRVVKVHSLRKPCP